MCLPTWLSAVFLLQLVVWLPALCRKMDVPYMIVSNKGRLGQLVRQKKATAVCLTDVNEGVSLAT